MVSLSPIFERHFFAPDLPDYPDPPEYQKKSGISGAKTLFFST
jgi:hypothetical protein